MLTSKNINAYFEDKKELQDIANNPWKSIKKEVLSPDGNSKVLFFDHDEMRMGVNIGRVQIENLTNNEIVSTKTLINSTLYYVRN
ncbi:hypothetical protein D3C80_1694650 [compost metagenome]